MAKKNLNHIITFTMGDPSGDGSGLKEDWTICANHSGKEIDKALEKWAKELGADVEDMCSDYEDRYIRGKALDALLEHGIIDKEHLEEDNDDDKCYWVDGDDDFVSIAMAMVKHFIPDFEWDRYYIPNQEQSFKLEGAGYGLYSL